MLRLIIIDTMDGTTAPPQNALQTSSNVAQPFPEKKRSTPWFNDGNIILEADFTQFRVYKGILSANSVVFADMFALSQADGEGEVEGCAVVPLQDKADDLRVVLQALHEATQW